MSYQVFARKYRPKTFNDILGQDHVVQTLRNAIEQNRLAHAYLFVGPRGTGKTTTARILAKALNCQNGPDANFDPDSTLCNEIANGTSLDVIEIDGASNNGVDHIRDLRENVQYSPSQASYKIYYIDEVHMLSTSAFNALLKTLEEPPEHVKFIFATTEPNKILPTIISRCQRFDLRPISTQTIADHLIYIAENEDVLLEPAAAWAVAKGADGGMRDAQSMLDQLVAFCGSQITEADVLSVFGYTSRETVAIFTQYILEKQSSPALTLINNQIKDGKDIAQLLDDTIGCLRALLVAKIDPNANNDGIPKELWLKLITASKSTNTDKLLNLVEIFAETEARMKWASNKKLHLEIGVIKAIQSLNDARISDVIAALAGAGSIDLEKLENVSLPPENHEQTQPSVNEVTQQAATKSIDENVTQPSLAVASTDLSSNTDAEVNEDRSIPDVKDTSIEASTHDEKSVDSHQCEDFNSESKTKIKSNNGMESLDALIDSAPESSSAPPSFPAESAQKTSSTNNNESKASEISEQSTKFENDFYDDPLIKKALVVFEASLKPS